MKRCAWVNLNNELSVRYHDEEWGVPVHDDDKLFEFIVLESAQAGLSWELILNKREGYRKAFCGFNPACVAKIKRDDIATLLCDPKIVRNRLKIESTINNAQRFIEVQNEFGSFSHYMWSWVGNVQISNKWHSIDQIPKTTELAIRLSKDLKKRGFRFLGPTIWYSHMQAVGMVNDHTTDCFRHTEVSAFYDH